MEGLRFGILRLRTVVALVVALVVAVAVAACGSDGTKVATSGGADTTASADTGSSSDDAAPRSNEGVTIVAPKQCGDDVVFQQSDPDGVLAQLPDELRKNYEIYPYDVRATPWATFSGKRGPWKIGYINFPIDNPWQVNLTEQLKKEFAKAKAAGLVEGDLVTYIQPSSATATPEQQNAAIQQMVRDGVDGILLHPLNATSQAAAIDAAGRAGVPIVLTSDVSPTSRYALNVFAQNNSPAFAGSLRLLADKGVIGEGKTLNVLRVRGIPGITVEQAFHDAATADMAACPGLKTVGTVWGRWNPATTKTQILQFLASHPDRVDYVMQQGAMEAGVIQAFEQVGREVPPMPFGGTSGGDLSWWAANKDRYESVGAQFGGSQVAYTTFRILLRTLAGNGPKLRDFSLPAAEVTNANIDDYATPGKPVTWIGDARGPLDGWASNDDLDNYFEKPGSPDGL